MNRQQETATGVERFGVAGLAAYRSLARSRNVSLATVIDHAERGTLREVVEMRDYGAQRKIEERNTARLAHMYRQRLVGAQVERDLWLRERGV